MNLSVTMRQIAAKSDEGKIVDRWLPFWVHCIDTAEIMRRLIRNWLPERIGTQLTLGADTDQICTFLAMVHDIGKLTYLFQHRLADCIDGQKGRMERSGLLTGAVILRDIQQTTHARAGYAILKRAGCPETLCTIVGSHHGKPQDSAADEDEIEGMFYRSYFGRETERPVWESLWAEWLIFSMDYAGVGERKIMPELPVPSQMLLTGLLVMADWIASNQTLFPSIERDEALTVEEARQRADYAWDRLKLPAFWDASCYCVDEVFFKERFSFVPNAVQSAVMDAVCGAENPGLIILEAQMGVGKTEAALAAAEYLNTMKQCGGIFFGLPTQATANGLFDRLLSWAETQSEQETLAIRLAHGAAELNDSYRALFAGNAQVSADEDGGLIVHSWFQGRKQALLANFVIGTVDQLLMAALKQKHLMLRHLGLAGKVVIIDECHAYDAYMNRYLDRTLSWLGTYGTPVILLSATLPVQRRAELVDAYRNSRGIKEPEMWRENTAYPLLTWTDGENICQKAISLENMGKTVSVLRMPEAQLAECLRRNSDGCAGVIVNTVAKAQRLAEELRGALPEFEILLFHSQYIAIDRAEKEKALLRLVGKQSDPEVRKKRVVVGTQVLEQSLDLDFDLMFSELCPMDLLLQRMGRLHRHTRVRPQSCSEPRFYVFTAEDGEMDKGSAAVYGRWLLKTTERYLPDAVSLPEDIPKLVQAVYREKSLEDTDWQKFCQQCEKQKQKADGYCIKPPPERSRRVKTLNGLLKNEVSKAAGAEAAVRDGDPSIDVLVLMQRVDGSVTFLPWQNGGAVVELTAVPDDETARQISAQRLRLPHRFCTPWEIDRTIAELEKLSGFSAELQKSPWLKGELFLLLDSELNTHIGETMLHYSRANGLRICKGDELLDVRI